MKELSIRQQQHWLFPTSHEVWLHVIILSVPLYGVGVYVYMHSIYTTDVTDRVARVSISPRTCSNCRTVIYLSHGLTMITSCHGSVFGKTGPLCREISGSSSKKGKLRWALMFSMVLAYMSCWPKCWVSVDSKYNAMATIQLTPI